MWKQQCLVELQQRQRNADKAIRAQVTKIEEQRVTREKQFEQKVHKITEVGGFADKDLLLRQRKIAEIREKYQLGGTS